MYNTIVISLVLRREVKVSISKPWRYPGGAGVQLNDTAAFSPEK